MCGAKAGPAEQANLFFFCWAAGTDQISFTLNFSKGASQMRPSPPQSAAC